MRLLPLVLAIISTAQAAPSAHLPINAQVPPVARANQQFLFVFSESTFVSASSAISYALSGSPEWLRLDSATRTFSGTPGTPDTGSIIVSLIATDQTGSTTMPVTFVISTDPGPRLGTPVADQIPAYGAVSSPDSLLLAPSTSLSLMFSPSTFTNTNDSTVYYAICANNTPLPSWLQFDPVRLSFSGSTPSGSSFSNESQSFGIKFTASDVFGFGAAFASFQLVIESHLFTFNSSIIFINHASELRMNSSILSTSLTLDGQSINPLDITQVSATTPSWLSIDPHTLVLSGTPPAGAGQENFTVTLTDIYGDTACTTVLLQMPNKNTSSLLSPIGALNATSGNEFLLKLDNSVLIPNTTVNVDLGEASSWLLFDQQSFEITGIVPKDLKPEKIFINITASHHSQNESQVVTIDVESPSQTSSPTEGSATNSVGANSSNQSVTSASGSTTQPHRQWIAAAVIVPFAVLSGLVLLFCCCWRRRKKHDWETMSLPSSKRKDLDPVQEEKAQGPDRVPMEMSGALGVFHKRSSSRFSKPPKIDMPGFWTAGTTKRNSRFRSSKVSVDRMSQGRKYESWAGDFLDFDFQQPRSFVTAEGGQISATQVWPAENHEKMISRDGYRPPASTDTSPAKRFSRGRSRRSNLSFGSSHLLSSQRISGIGHGKSALSHGSGSLMLGSRGFGHGDGGGSRGPLGYGTVRDSWRHIREEASWTTTDESSSQDLDRLSSHNPLTSSNSLRIGQASSRIPGSGLNTIRRLTVRQVQPSNPLQEYHKKRARQRQSSNPFLSAGPLSSRVDSHNSILPAPRAKKAFINRESMVFDPSTPPMQTHRRSYSTSSLNPPSRPSPGRTRSFNNRSSTRNNYSINPAGDPLGVPRFHSRNSMASYDSRFESASESQSTAAYPLQEGIREEADDEGNRVWQIEHRGPVHVHEDCEDDLVSGSTPGPVPGSLLDRLTNIRARAEARDDFENRIDEERGLKIGKTRAKRLDQTTGWRKDDPANTSMRGEVQDIGGRSSGAFL